MAVVGLTEHGDYPPEEGVKIKEEEESDDEASENDEDDGVDPYKDS